MPQSRRSYLPPARRRTRRRFPFRLIVVAIVLIAAVYLIADACGSGGNGGNRARGRTPQPSAAARPARPTSRAGTAPRGGSPRPGSTPGAGFAPASPTVEPTCAPDDLLRLVDKDHALPDSYVPPDLVALEPKDSSPRSATAVQLRHEAADALHRMLDQARTENIFFLAQSAYRSYQYQEQVYAQEVSSVGQAQADRESARPGHSEHQLGLAVDFTTRGLDYDLNQSFAATPEGRWLAQHAAEFGFVLSYPEGKEAETGYEYEPWHYRYVGVDVAQQFVQSGQTLNRWLAARQVGCHA